MAAKTSNRLDKLEATVDILLSVVKERTTIRKDCEVQACVQHIEHGSQTVWRKNITERGNQIQPRTADACVSVGVSRPLKSTDTQTDRVISTADIFLKKVSTQVLKHIADVDSQWLSQEVRDQRIVSSFLNIQNRKFNTNDVVTALVTLGKLVAQKSHAQDSEYDSEYETETEGEDGSTPTPRPTQQNVHSQGASLYYKVRQAA